MLRPTDPKLFFSKNDPGDRRLGEVFKPTTLNEAKTNDFALIGFPDDEGIGLNGGRLGAKEAPDTIRRFFYKMTPSVDLKNQCLDVGNIFGNSLADRHKAAESCVSDLLQKKAFVLSMGGGHDYGYPDGAAFLKNANNPLVINFDAHLDVRPYKEHAHSGTPFYRLLSDFKNFDFCEIGVQSQCNSTTHMEWARKQGAHILGWDSLLNTGDEMYKHILKFLEPFLRPERDTYISVDIDGFASNFAMGCSAPSPQGLDPINFFRVFNILREKLNIKVLGIYEVSPPLDSQDLTSRLAAQILYRRIFG